MATDLIHPHTLATPRVRRAVQLALVAAFAAGGSAALRAQQAPTTSPDSSDQQQLQEVVVTGTMIKRTDAETAESVTILKAEDIKTQGITTTEQLIQQIAANQATGSYNLAAAVSTWTGGGSFASLRGLGSSRTLVLLDGQRLADNVVLGAGIDLSTIPVSAIERVEVLKEGASSLYGSDAIAGVINIITRKNYDQGELSVNFDHPQHDGGGHGNVDLTFGKGNLAADGYNFMVTATYQKTQALQATQRSFAATGYDPARGLANTNGPVGTWPGSYLDLDTDPVGGPNTPTGNIYQVGSYPACPGNPYPLTQAYGDCAYGYSSATDLVPSSQIYSGLVSFTKALPGNNTLGVQYYWGRADVTTWGGPMEYVENMNSSSPYYPTAANSMYVPSVSTGPAGAAPNLGYGTVEVGWTDPYNNRYNSTTNTEQRALLTFSGDNGGWNYELNLDYSQNNNVQSVTGYPDLDLIAPGGVVSDLINPFGPQSAAGQALIDSAYQNGELAQGLLRFESLNGHASHELGDAFNAGRPSVLAFGFDVHGEQISYHTTALAATLEGATAFAPLAVTGSQNDLAAYLELNVPVTHSLDFTVSDRQDRYSDFGTTNNAKVQFRWQPFDFLTFRGAASTGFRAPSLVDLYSPQVLGAIAGNMTGPGCPAGSGAIFTAANCLSQGVGVYGGNPALGPEKSQNFDFGFVIEPLKNLGITVDYYRVNLSNAIESVPAAAIYGNPTEFAGYYKLNNAGTLTQANNIANACVTGSSTSGSTITPPAGCGYILQLLQNSGGVNTSGIDLDASYQLRTAVGTFRAGYDSTFVTDFKRQPYQGAGFVNIVGWYNQGYIPVLRYQHTLTLDWSYGRFGAGLSNTFMSRYIDQWPDEAGNPLMVASYSLVNGYLSVKPTADLTVVFGIRNLFDRNPPFSNQTNTGWQAGYDESFADPLGRNFYLQAKYDFNLWH